MTPPPRTRQQRKQDALDRPQRLQAWREANELEGRDLMRDGHWLAT